MATSNTHSLKALVVFRNVLYPELIRSVHMYQLKEGIDEQVEREYVFNKYGAYEEIGMFKVLTLEKFELSNQHEGKMNGVWLCIYVFDVDRHCPPNLDHIPSLISVSKNPKLASIPTLADDLETIIQLGGGAENREPSQITPETIDEENIDSSFQLRGAKLLFPLDLNLPYPEPENEGSDQSTTGILEKKKKRATAKDVSRIALADLVKCFDLPIVEASKNLKVGVTALKKKCREYGIPRWPHRKIKSLDSLIRDLQEEFIHQQEEDKDAAILVAKRQRMLENEKQSIEREPFIEIQRETKRFRQDIFKRRHRARAREGQDRTLSLL